MQSKNLTRIMTPGAVSPGWTIVASIAMMVILCALDINNGPEIWFQSLYFFPLAAAAFHCPKNWQVALVFTLSVALQGCIFLTYGLSVQAQIANALITVSSSIFSVLMVRIVRLSYFKIEAVAATDALTKLPNRRAFYAMADLEIARRKRYGGVFSLAMLDLDNFKSLNDSQGHHMGDMALVLVADLLRENTRRVDMAARLGGDEFAVLMPDTHAGECAVLCHKLAAEIARRMAEAGFTITASIGYAAFERPPATTSAALQRADEAMYLAKAQGKGSVAQARIHTAPLHPVG